MWHFLNRLLAASSASLEGLAQKSEAAGEVVEPAEQEKETANAMPGLGLTKIS